jgi:hypothetical protein
VDLFIFFLATPVRRTAAQSRVGQRTYFFIQLFLAQRFNTSVATTNITVVADGIMSASANVSVTNYWRDKKD